MASHDPALLARCGFTLGRLSEAAERSVLRSLWLNHETARVVARLFSRGAAPMAPEDLLAMAAGVPGPMPSVEEAAARRFWGLALRLWSPRVSRAPGASVPEITNQLHGLARDGMPAGDLALETPLRLAQVTGWSLPSAALALPPGDHERWESSFLAAVTAEAEGSLERLQGLERDFARWQGRLPQLRSDSRLLDAVVLLGTTHALTPKYLTETLGLTRQAAARLLKRLEGLGIVRRATARQRWIVYVAENLGIAAVPENTRSTDRPDSIDTEAIDRALESAYAALDKAVRKDRLQ